MNTASRISLYKQNLQISEGEKRNLKQRRGARRRTRLAQMRLNQRAVETREKWVQRGVEDRKRVRDFGSRDDKQKDVGKWTML